MNMQSENINELTKALVMAQGEMMPAVKDSVNPFFKSKYADLASVVEASRPSLIKYGLCVMQTTTVSADKNTLVTTLAHTSGQWIKSEILINPVKNDPQGLGAAMTYLRRYSYAAMVGVVTEDDDGETAVGRGQAVERKQEQQKKPYQNDRHPDTNNLPISNELVDDPSKKDLALNQEQIDTLRSYLPRITIKCKNNFFDFFGIKNESELYKIPADKYKGTINSFDLNIDTQVKAL
jgi:ERF superfamily